MQHDWRGVQLRIREPLRPGEKSPRVVERFQPGYTAYVAQLVPPGQIFQAEISPLDYMRFKAWVVTHGPLEERAHAIAAGVMCIQKGEFHVGEHACEELPRRVLGFEGGPRKG